MVIQVRKGEIRPILSHAGKRQVKVGQCRQANLGQSGRGIWVRGPGAQGVTESVGVAGELDEVGVVGEAVEQGRGQLGVLKDLGPAGELQV